MNTIIKKLLSLLTFSVSLTTYAETLTVEVDLDVQGSINASDNPITVSTTSDLTFPTGGFVTDGSNSGIYSTTSDAISIATGGVERLNIDADGNVGIATANPQETFHVNGNLRVDGSVTMTRQGDIFMGQFGVGTDQGLLPPSGISIE